MKRIVYYLIGMFLPLAIMSGCTDFPEDFGMDATPLIEDFKAIPVSKSSYQPQCQLKIDGNLSHVESAYVSIGDWSETLDLSKFSKNGTYTMTLPELNFDKSYNVEFIIQREACTDRESYQFNYSKSDFAPLLHSFTISLSAPNQLTIVALVEKRGKFDLTGNFTWFRKQSSNNLTKVADIQTSISEEGAYHVLKAVVNLNDAPLTASTSYYPGCALTNAFGSHVYFSDNPIYVYSSTRTYSGDGLYSDYIRLCGVKWAKGNLQYDNGTWRIAPEQWSIFSYSGENTSSTQIEHFALGETKVTIPGSRRSNTSNPTYGQSVDIQGTSYDVVTAHLGKRWGIPSYAQFKELTYASKSSVTVNGVPGYLYWSPTTTKRYEMKGLTVSPSVLKNTGMLFLPSRGYCEYKDYWFYNHLCYYLTSESYSSYSYNYYIYYWNGDNVYANKSDELIYMPIRPVRLY